MKLLWRNPSYTSHWYCQKHIPRERVQLSWQPWEVPEFVECWVCLHELQLLLIPR